MKPFNLKIWGLAVLLLAATMIPIGSQATPARSFEQYIAEGNNSNRSFIDKFALNNDIETGDVPEDIWEFGGMYEYSDYATLPGVGVADIVSVSSSNDNDEQEIAIEGLDATGYGVSQMVTLEGQTRVAITALWRIFRMYNNDDDATGSDLAGTIYCYSGTTETAGVPSGDSVVKAIIDNGNNQTQMIHYIVPMGFVGFLKRGEIGIDYSGGGIFSGDESAVFQYKSRRYRKRFRVKKTVSLLTSGTSVYSDYRIFPDPIPALTDIKITVLDVSDDMGAWATFDIELVAESELSQGFLTSIGQPQ